MGKILTKTLGISEDRTTQTMNQRQFFHSSLIVFSVYLFISGFGLLAEAAPQLLPWLNFGLRDFYAVMRWQTPAFSSASYIVPLLLPSLTSIGFAILIFFKASDLTTKVFPRDQNSPLWIHLQPEEWLHWCITLIGIFLIGWITVPAISSSLFHPLVMNFFPDIDTEKSNMAFIHDMYWSSLVGNIARFLIQGSFGLVCLLYAPRLAAWIIRIQKHPKPTLNE